jgi:hypothetical protein
MGTAKKAAIRIRSDLTSKWAYALVFVASVCLFLSFQLGLSTVSPLLVNIGDETDEGYLRGFHQREWNEWSSFRWTMARSYVTLPEAGHIPVTITLAINGWRPEQQAAPRVALLANDREVARFVAEKELRVYEFRYIPPVLALERDLVLEIHSDTFAPPADEAERTLGVLVDSVQIAPIAEAVWSSYLLSVALLSVAMGIWYLVVCSLGGAAWQSCLGAAALLALICLVIVLYPLKLFGVSLLVLGFCFLSYGSLLIIDATSSGAQLKRSITSVVGAAAIFYGRLAGSLTRSSRVTALVLLLALCANLLIAVPAMVDEVALVLKNPILSYGDKMKQRWGDFYSRTAFAQESTAPDAVLAYVPWLSNIGWRADRNPSGVSLMEYFLYPRHFMTPAENDGRKEFTHIWVVQTRSYRAETEDEGWPQFYVPVRWVTFMPQRRQVWTDSFTLQTDSQAVVLEDFEGSAIFVEWASEARRVTGDTPQIVTTTRPEFRIVDASPGDCGLGFNGNPYTTRALYLDLTYTQSEYDYWGKSVDLALDEVTSIEALVRSNMEQRVNIVGEVRFADGHVAVFGSPANQAADRWECLKIDDIYNRARDFGLARGWDVRGMRISMVGVNAGHPPPMPYLEKWGVVEIARGGEQAAWTVGSEIENGPYHFSLGQSFEGAGKLAEAMAEYQQAIQLEPGDARFHLASGEVLRRQGEVEEAMAAYERAILLAPGIAWPHFALGEHYFEIGDEEVALLEYQRAIAISPNLSEAIFALGGLHEARGELPDAYAQFEVLSRFPFDSYHQAALEAMQRIEDK